MTGEAINITILDTFVALTAGFIVIPACFSYGIEPGAGPVSYTHLDVYKRQLLYTANGQEHQQP